MIHLLQKASKSVASGHHHLLKKVDENFCFLPANERCREANTFLFAYFFFLVKKK